MSRSFLLAPRWPSVRTLGPALPSHAVLALLAVPAVLSGALPPGELHGQETPDAPRSIYEAAWMGGCWLADSGTGRDEEVWLAPAGDMMLGMARSVRGDRVASYELATLAEDEEGLVFSAHPSGQAGAQFRVVTLVPNGMRVENREHDFPQAIEYLRTARDSLVARVFGNADDDEPAFQIFYGRNNC